jgi:hypothetical protein
MVTFVLLNNNEPEIITQLLNAPEPSVAKLLAALKSKLTSLEQFENALLPIEVNFELKIIFPTALVHPLNAPLPMVKAVAELPVFAVKIILPIFDDIARVANEFVAIVSKPAHAEKSNVKLDGLGIV